MRDKKRHRGRVFWKCGGRCYYCGAQLDPDKWHVEHVIPVGQQGSGALANLVPSCQPCNSAKKSRTPEEFKAFRLAQMGAAVDMYRRVLTPLHDNFGDETAKTILDHIDQIAYLLPALKITFYGETCNPHAGVRRSSTIKTDIETEREQ